MSEMVSYVIDSFRKKYGTHTLITSAPGRINIIGEHTDYNDGFVLPAAIDYSVIMVFGRREDTLCEFKALDIDEEVVLTPGNLLKRHQKQWMNFFLGVINALDLGEIPFGFNVMFASDIPLGAGLSSSAALESAFGLGISLLFNKEYSMMSLALAGQKAEHDYVGVQCGIMDQFASCYGKKDQAIFLDCRSLEHEYVPIELEEYQWVLFDSKVKHDLASTEYNTRRQECRTGVLELQKKYPTIQSLRDAKPSQLEEVKEQLTGKVYNRCRFVIEENQRVLDAKNALEVKNLQALGQLINKSHQGLSTQYEVSCPELDWLVNKAFGLEGVLGSRMMGGGFGGCTINLLRKNQIESFKEEMLESYRNQFGIEGEVLSIEISDGAHQIK